MAGPLAGAGTRANPSLGRDSRVAQASTNSSSSQVAVAHGEISASVRLERMAVNGARSQARIETRRTGRSGGRNRFRQSISTRSPFPAANLRCASCGHQAAARSGVRLAHLGVRFRMQAREPREDSCREAWRRRGVPFVSRAVFGSIPPDTSGSDSAIAAKRDKESGGME